MSILTQIENAFAAKPPEQQAAQHMAAPQAAITPQPNQQPAPATAPATAPEATAPTAANPTDPNAPASLQHSNTADPIQSPMAKHAELFKIDDKAEGKADPSLSDPIFNIDTAKLNEGVAKMNFQPADEGYQQLIDKALSGDRAAFMQVLDNTARNVYSQAIGTSAQLAEQGAQQITSRLQTHLPNQIKDLTANSALMAENEIYNDAAVSPVVQAIAKQVQAANPNATPAQIVQQTNAFIKDFAGAVGTADPSAAAAGSTDPRVQQAAQQDFSNFFSG